MERLGFYVCVADLEDELIRSLGAAAVERVVDAQGDLRSFRTLQKQAAWQERSTEEQLRRFLGSGAVARSGTHACWSMRSISRESLGHSIACSLTSEEESRTSAASVPLVIQSQPLAFRVRHFGTILSRRRACRAPAPGLVLPPRVAYVPPVSFLAAVAQVRAMSRTADAVEEVAVVSRRAGSEGAKLVVFPEALLGGYPRGAAFGAAVGERSSAGRDEFLAYSRNAVTLPGPEVERLGEIARENGLHLVVGLIERVGTTLFCGAVTIDDAGVLWVFGAR